MIDCQGCGSSKVSQFLSLGSMPPVNAFLTAEQIPSEQSFPLELYFCSQCTLVQLWPTVDPSLLFGEYNFLSSASRSNVAHLTDLAAGLSRRLQLTSKAKVLEIGSNDGTLLAQFKPVTTHLLGVDPAANLAAAAQSLGVRTRVQFFSSTSADEIANAEGLFDLILAINVVAHTPKYVDLLTGVRRLLRPGGHFVMECPHVVPTLLHGEIDTIYHEHVYCFSLHALHQACAVVGLRIVDVEKVAMQGGSLRLFMQNASENESMSPRVQALLAEEESAGVAQLAVYQGIAARAAALRVSLLRKVKELREGCEVVIGLGAPARGVVLINYCNLSAQDLNFVVDDTPLKQGKLVPGKHIPVFDWGHIDNDQKLGCLLLSWNYRSEVLEKLKARTRRARVLIPFPAMEEVSLG
ncbi:MAG TPA: class I SAM-dependent methyltransferase [Polyangiaceae bacterium]|nr:class I SAM-dependent methyltransferase [Polyangiaceae bacterium]